MAENTQLLVCMCADGGGGGETCRGVQRTVVVLVMTDVVGEVGVLFRGMYPYRVAYKESLCNYRVV